MKYGRRCSFRSLVMLSTAAVSLWIFNGAARAQVSPAEHVFSGTIGEKTRIQVRLRREGKRLSGSYFYERVQKELKLSGEIDAQNKFTLREYNESGAQTGIFKGEWRPSDCAGCRDSLYGNWSRPDGKGSQIFSLTIYPVTLRTPLKLLARSITERNRKLNYEITLEYPQIEGSSDAGVTGFNELMRAKAAHDASDYRRDFVGGSGGSEGNAFSLSYLVGVANDDLVSVELSSYFHYGGAGGRYTFTNTINFDLNRRRLIKFEELFRPGVDYMKWLKDYSVRDLERQFKDDSFDEKELQERVDEMVGSEEKWLITPEGLELVFEWIDPSPHGGADAHIVVPSSEIKQFIRPGGPLAALVR